MSASLQSIDTVNPAGVIFRNFVQYDLSILYQIFVPVVGEREGEVAIVHIIKAYGRGGEYSSHS